MKYHLSRVCLIGSMAFVMIFGCDKESESRKSLKGQSNAVMTFYGLAIDEEGRPLADVRFMAEVEKFPDDWTFDSRGKPNEHRTVVAESGPDGRFQMKLNGYIFRMKQVEYGGYHHFFDEAIGSSDAIGNMAITLISWGDPCYKSNPDSPAVYVLVKNGVHEISALPCRGGADFAGKYELPNKPGWPKRPSLPDVALKQPVSAPSSQESP